MRFKHGGVVATTLHNVLSAQFHNCWMRTLPKVAVVLGRKRLLLGTASNGIGAGEESGRAAAKANGLRSSGWCWKELSYIYEARKRQEAKAERAGRDAGGTGKGQRQIQKPQAQLRRMGHPVTQFEFQRLDN